MKYARDTAGCSCENNKLQLVLELPGTKILQAEGNKMKSLSDLADEYERWAAEDDVIVSGILSKADGFPDGVRQEQLRHATLLAEEARNFRDHAERLRRSVGQQVSILTIPDGIPR